jgi:hypothetical protein
MPWKYDAGERPKRKHGWDKDEAGFVEVDGVLVGKCPKRMSNAEAERLLNEGVPHTEEVRGGVPKAIYALRDGVLYCAIPTRVGVSYHGFPMLPARFDRLPVRVRDRVTAYAQNHRIERDLREWLAR